MNGYKYTESLKRTVMKDWYKEFSHLKFLNKYFIGRRIGPLLLYLSAYPRVDKYTPGFGIFNLIEDAIAPNIFSDTSISIGLPHEQLPGTDMNLAWIKPEQHKEAYPIAIKMLKEITYGLLEDRQFTLQEMIEIFKTHITKGNDLYGDLIHLPLFVSWAGDAKQAWKLLLWSKEQTKKLTTSSQGNFASYGNHKTWVTNVGKMISSPEILRERCEKNVIKHKFKKIPYQDFTTVSRREKEGQIFTSDN